MPATCVLATMYPHDHWGYEPAECCWRAAYKAMFEQAGREAPEPSMDWTTEVEINGIKARLNIAYENKPAKAARDFSRATIRK